MSADLAIKVEGVSKLYRLGRVGTGSLKHDINRAWHRLRGKDDPFLQVGRINDRTKSGDSDYVWALQDINFEVKQGEVLGIIGRNGAGKSTLLKILSKITSPTKGTIHLNGKIASLLEVGTGFHPEMTGRENIFMNGAILGMRKNEIKKKFDEIVDFAGVSAYVDTPVKRYSSGMLVRLGFAVAAHLEPDILVIDEVLAVGDAEFQKKCLGRMKDISVNSGRTVLFVSHNMAAVKSLCHRGLLLENGQTKYLGDVQQAVADYLLHGTYSMMQRNFGQEYHYSDFHLLSIGVNASGHNHQKVIDENDAIEFNTLIEITKEDHDLHLTFMLNNEYGEPLFTFSHARNNIILKKGENKVTCLLPFGFLNTGTYYLTLSIIRNKREMIFNEKDILVFSVVEGQRELGSWLGKEPGFIRPRFEWSVF
jgi:lipopolysaccharide transport system ATP-binding protein